MLGAIATINDPPPFHPLNQIFQLLDLEYGAFIEIRHKRSKISKGNVATLALGSRPRQGLAKVRAKKEA
jgi:hypothetical protein